MSDLDTSTIISNTYKEFRPLYDIKVPISALNLTKVPLGAKQLAEKFVEARRPRAVVQEIYEMTLSIETGAVIQCLYPSRFNEYVTLMEEEDKYQTLKQLESQGDGVILK